MHVETISRVVRRTLWRHVAVTVQVRAPRPEDPYHVKLLLGVRKQRDFTQRQLAGELGVSTSTIRGWENGRSDPHPMFVRLIAALLKPLPKR